MPFNLFSTQQLEVVLLELKSDLSSAQNSNGCPAPSE